MAVIYKQCAAVVILREGQNDPELLTQDRVDKQGLDLPGGNVKEGETPQDAAKRETFEESGLEVEILEQLGETFQTRRGDEGEIVVIVHLFEACVIGGSLRTSNETAGFRWVSLKALPTAPIAGKVMRPGYPNGMRYAQAERALTQNLGEMVFSAVRDPYNLAVVA